MKNIKAIICIYGLFAFAGCTMNLSVNDTLGASAPIVPPAAIDPSPPNKVKDKIGIVNDSGENALADLFSGKQITNGENIVSIVITMPPANGSLKFDGLVAKYTPNVGFKGADSFMYQVTGDKGTTESGSISVQVRRAHTWTGLGSTKLWSNSENWISGAPTASDYAYFEDAWSQCEVQVDGVQSVSGLIIENNFLGNIKLNNLVALGSQLNVGSNGIQMLGGTIDLGQGKLSVSGVVDISGGNLNAESGLIVSSKSFTIGGTAVVNSQNSTFEFTGDSGGTITIPAGFHFFNVSFTHDSSSKNIAGTMIVDGSLLLNVSFVAVNGGNIEAHGDIIATKMNGGSQTTILKVVGTGNQLLRKC